MTLIIQATTLSGNIVDHARWEVNNGNQIQEKQIISVNMEVKETNLVSFLKKIGKRQSFLPSGTSLDEDEKLVTVSFEIRQIRHMINTASKKLNTLAIVVPVNRTAEQTMLFILDQGKCDKKFVEAVKNFIQAPF